MTAFQKSVLWAAIIISAALIMAGMNLGAGASFGVIGGLAGAAIASTQSDGSCRRGCLQ